MRRSLKDKLNTQYYCDQSVTAIIMFVQEIPTNIAIYILDIGGGSLLLYYGFIEQRVNNLCITSDMRVGLSTYGCGL
jgi:hypothetical protein